VTLLRQDESEAKPLGQGANACMPRPQSTRQCAVAKFFRWAETSVALMTGNLPE
jgi:hypothetical protein